MTEKAKNTAARMAALPFLALWTAANIAGWLFTLWLWETLRIGYANFGASALVIALVPGMIAAAGQWALMTYGLKKSVLRWLPVSLGGYLLSAAGYYFYVDNSAFSSSPAVMLSFLFVPVALVQAAWLRTRVKNAWLWVVGAVVSAVLFALPIQNSASSNDIMAYIFLALAAVLQGVVTGSVMRALWSQERVKAKLADTSIDHERMTLAEARLNELSEVDNKPQYDLEKHLRETRF